MRADCHIHMILDGVYYRAAIDHQRTKCDDALIRARLKAYVDAGITYLRDGGDAWGVCLRAAELAGEYGIEYRTPAFPIHRNGRYGSFIGRGYDTLAEYRALVREACESGADFIKLMTAGLMDFNQYGALTSSPLEADEVRELISIAHGEGFAVMVHVNGDAAIRAAVDAGADSVEHGAYPTGETLRAMAQAGTIWVPTLATFGNLIGDGRYPDAVLTALLDNQSAALRRFAALGGLIAPGSDNGAYRVPHVRGTLDEYAWLGSALGEDAGAIAQRGAAAVRRRFVRGGEGIR